MARIFHVKYAPARLCMANMILLPDLYSRNINAATATATATAAEPGNDGTVAALL
jgi:hypothetical protein